MRWMLSLPMVLALAACERPVDTGVQALPPSPVVDRADAADAAEQELDWLQMMPKDELAALERGEGPEVEHNGNRRMPQFGTFRTVDTVLQRPVRLPGYVVPLANAQDGRLTEFLFAPYYGACIHCHPRRRTRSCTWCCHARSTCPTCTRRSSWPAHCVPNGWMTIWPVRPTPCVMHS